MKFCKRLFHKNSEPTFFPFIDKDGYLKLPKNKRGRFIVVFLFMIAMMLATFALIEIESSAWNLLQSLID